jgi:putative hemolysin
MPCWNQFVSTVVAPLRYSHKPVKRLRETDVVNSHAVDLFTRKLKLPVPAPLLEWVLAMEEISRIINAARADGADRFFDGALCAMDVSYCCTDADRRKIPSKGPALLVANHPFGMLEGLILGSLLSGIRPDFRFVANSLLADIPEIAARTLSVDPFGETTSIHGNCQALRQAWRWLQQGGMLVTFPAGEVSNLQGIPPAVQDSAWNSRLLRIARRTGAPVVPAFFSGRNGLMFQMAGLLHPAFRTALLCRELVNKRGGRFTLALGTPVRAESMARFATDRDLTDHVRARTYALGHRSRSAPAVTKKKQEPIATAQ